MEAFAERLRDAVAFGAYIDGGSLGCRSSNGRTAPRTLTRSGVSWSRSCSPVCCYGRWRTMAASMWNESCDGCGKGTKPL